MSNIFSLSQPFPTPLTVASSPPFNKESNVHDGLRGSQSEGVSAVFNSNSLLPPTAMVNPPCNSYPPSGFQQMNDPHTMHQNGQNFSYYQGQYNPPSLGHYPSQLVPWGMNQNYSVLQPMESVAPSPQAAVLLNGTNGSPLSGESNNVCC